MSDRTLWWLGVVLAIANLAVGAWDIALGNAWGAVICFTVCAALVVSCSWGSNLRRHP